MFLLWFGFSNKLFYQVRGHYGSICAKNIIRYRYPHVIKLWRTNWDALTTFFNYPVEIRRVMYTTNIIESVNSKFRKATGARKVFPSDDAVLKCLYMAALELEKKWTRSIKDWPAIYAQLVLLFEDRVQ